MGCGTRSGRAALRPGKTERLRHGLRLFSARCRATCDDDGVAVPGEPRALVLVSLERRPGLSFTLEPDRERYGHARDWRWEATRRPATSGWPGPLATGASLPRSNTARDCGEILAVVLPDARAVKGLALASGQELWSTRPETEVVSLRGQGADLYLALQNKTVTRLKAQTGETIWSVRADDLWGNPVPAPGVCILPQITGELLALHADTGKPLWRFRLRGRFASPVVADGETIYALTHSEFLYAIETASGELVGLEEFGTGAIDWWPTRGARYPLQPMGKHIAFLENSEANHLRVLQKEGARLHDFRRFSNSEPLIPAATIEVLALFPTSGSGRARAYAPATRQTGTFAPGPGTLLAVGNTTNRVISVTSQGVGALMLTQATWSALVRPSSHLLPEVVTMVALGGLAVWFLGHYVNAHRVQLPPRHGAGAKLCLLFGLVAAFSVALLLLGSMLVQAIACGIMPLAQVATPLMLGLAALLPLLTFTLGHRDVMRRLRARCQPDEEQVRSDPGLSREVAALCHEMGLARPVTLLSTSEVGVSPMVYGRSPRDSVLIIPQNLRALCALATAGDRTLASHLARFVLAHELAHIRNGDVRITPLLMALHGPWVAGWVALVIAYWTHRFARVDPILSQATLAGCYLLGAEILLVAWMSRSILAERERLADATAVLYSPPKVVDALTQREQGMSSLERFVALLRPSRIMARRAQSFLGVDVPRSIPASLRWLIPETIPGRVRSFRKALLNRTGQARRRTAVLDARAGQRWWTALQFGLSMAALYGCLMCAIRSTQWAANLPLAAASRSPWLVCIAIPEDRTVMSDVEAWLSGTLVNGFAVLLALLLAVEAVDSSAAGHIGSGQAHRTGMWRMLLALVAASGGILAAYRFVPYGLQWKGIGALGPLVSGCLALTLGVLFAEFSTLRHLRKGVMLSVVVTMFGFCFAVLIGVSTTLLDGDSFDCAVITAIGFFGTFVILQLAPIGLPRTGADAAERITGGFWPRESPVVYLSPWSAASTAARMALLLMPGVLLCSLGVLAFSVVCGPAYLEFINWLSSDPRLAMLAVAFPTGRSNELNGVGDLGSLLAYQTLLNPDLFKVLIQTAIVATAGLAAVTCHNIFGYGLRRRAAGIALARVPDAIELQLRVRAPKLEPVIKAWGQLATDEAASTGRPFLETHRMPALRATALLVLGAKTADNAKSHLSRMLDWVATCAVPQQGFAPVPGGAASEFHTLWALRALRAYGQLTPLARSDSERWIRSRLAAELRPSARIRPRNFLDLIYHIHGCLAELQSLDRLSRRTRAALADRCAQAWLRSEKSVEETFQLLSIVSWLNQRLPEAVGQPLEKYWLPLHEAALPGMDPRLRFREVAQLVQILQWLHPRDYLDRASVHQALDLMQRTLSKDVEFLRKQLRVHAVQPPPNHEPAN